RPRVRLRVQGDPASASAGRRCSTLLLRVRGARRRDRRGDHPRPVRPPLHRLRIRPRAGDPLHPLRHPVRVPGDQRLLHLGGDARRDQPGRPHAFAALLRGSGAVPPHLGARAGARVHRPARALRRRRAGRRSEPRGVPPLVHRRARRVCRLRRPRPRRETRPPPRGAVGPALPGLDPEAEAWARDLLYEADPFMGYLIPSFFSDFPMGYVHTYKLGQVRVAFLGSVFGRETLLWMLRNTHAMGGDPTQPANQRLGFVQLVETATGLSAEEVDHLFHDWLKRRYLPAYDQASTRIPGLALVSGLPYEPEAVVSSPDGETLLVRGVDREMGRGSLFPVDARDPSRHHLVALDARPGPGRLPPVPRLSS